MARTRYAPDRGLTARMTVTMFLLGLVFVAFVAAIIGILVGGHASAAAIVFDRPDLRRRQRLHLAVLLGQDRAGRGGRPEVVTPQEAPELHAIVDRLCALADMDKPRVAIAPTRMPNAFATGRNSKNSVLCVTEGLLGPQLGLTPEELEGVLAHELSHVAHKDVQVMTVASLLAIVAGPAGAVRLLLRDLRRRHGGAATTTRRIPADPRSSWRSRSWFTRSASCSSGCCPGTGSWRPTAAARCSPASRARWRARCRRSAGGMTSIPNEDLRSAEPLNAFYFAPAMKLTRGGGRGRGRRPEPGGDLLHPPEPGEAPGAAGEDPAPARRAHPRRTERGPR